MANKIAVSTEWLEKCARDLQQISNSIYSAAGTLSGIQLRRDEGGSLKVSVSCRLQMTGGNFSGNSASDDIRAMQQAAKALSGAAGSFSRGVAQGAKIYEKTENDAIRLLRGIRSSAETNVYSGGNSGRYPSGGKNISGGGSIDTSESKDKKSWIARFLNNELKVSDAVLSGDKSGSTTFMGIATSGTVSGSVLYYEASIKNKMSWKWKDKDGNWDFKSFGLSTEAKATGALAKGSAEGNFGYLHGKVEGSVLTGAVSGEAKATLWDDGKFNPSLFVGAKAEASVLQGKAELGLGTDQYGAYVKADGDVLHAEAEAKAGIGYIGKDKNGNAQYGAAAKASAMASVAQGKVKGGITIFGIDIDVGVKGYAAAAGVEAGASVTTSGVKANFSGALGLGAGLDVSVDWSDAKWIGDTVDTVGSFFSGASKSVDNIGQSVFGWW